MVNKLNTKKTKQSKINKRKVVALVIFGCMVIAIGWLALALQATRAQLNDVATVKMAGLINAAVDGLTEPVPISAPTGERYFYQIRLRLPASDQTDHQLIYNYSPSTEGSTEELIISSRITVNAAKAKVLGAPNINETFNNVPELQACNRAFRVTFKTDPYDEYTLAFEKNLSDGRTAYVYANTICEANKDSLTEYLRKIESY